MFQKKRTILMFCLLYTYFIFLSPLHAKAADYELLDLTVINNTNLDLDALEGWDYTYEYTFLAWYGFPGVIPTGTTGTGTITYEYFKTWELDVFDANNMKYIFPNLPASLLFDNPTFELLPDEEYGVAVKVSYPNKSKKTILYYPAIVTPVELPTF